MIMSIIITTILTYALGITMYIVLPIIVIVLIIRALLKYIKSKDVRKEKAETRKSLGDVLREHRTECKMTQEFVAETPGVSRQAVSKWENGTSDPSTSNLIALAKMFGVSAEELLKEVEKNGNQKSHVKGE
jgi:DNA-binding XRE family transcriptional regulator